MKCNSATVEDPIYFFAESISAFRPDKTEMMVAKKP
jgi:hypothetical protein